MQETKDISPYKLGLRTKIIDAAMSLFIARGIRAVTMDEVAKSISISKRTVYELFGTKEDLLIEGFREFARRHEEEAERRATECSNVMEIILRIYGIKVEQFHRTNPQFFTDLSMYPNVLSMLNAENERNRERYILFMQRGVEEGYFRNDIDYRLTWRLFDALGNYVMSSELYRQYSIEEIFVNIVFVTIRGLCTEKGVNALKEIIRRR